jgi:hypothetical protein
MAHPWVLLGDIILSPLSGRGKKQNSLMHTILKYFQLGKFADLKHTNCGAVWNFNYSTGFYQHLTHTGWLFVSRFQQKWTERRKHPLTLQVCLMNLNLILPFFFLIPLYIFRISDVFIIKFCSGLMI